MGEVLTKVAGFAAMIALGWWMRVSGRLRHEDGGVLCAIVLNVTLPCSLVAGMNGATFDASLLLVFLLGLASNVVLVGAAWLRARDVSPRVRALEMLNSGGYNMGCFAIPFVSGLFPPAALPYVCMFDAGNAVLALGGTASLAASAMDAERAFSLRELGSRLLRSRAFVTYMALLGLSAAGVSLPEPVVEVAGMIGGSNAFVAMFMIGVMLEVRVGARALASVKRILTTRYLVTGAIAAAFFALAPLPVLVRQVVAVSLLSPLSNVNSVFSEELGLDASVAAGATALSIVISTVAMSVLTVVLAA